MVKPFQFARIPKILFGPGKIGDLPLIASDFGKRIILVTGKESFSGTGRDDKLIHDLAGEGISCDRVIVSGEPSPELIDSVSAKFDVELIFLVVAIGGGSTVDAGKAISAMVGKQIPVMEFLEGVGTREHPGTKIPFIAVPTTSGTGSEATKNAVISQIGRGGFKRSLRHDNLVPDIAIVDPQLTLSCPPDITAATGMDCFTQLVEAFLSDKAIAYTDALAFEGIKAVKESLEKSYIDGSGLPARSGMSFAALTSGICLANAGLGIVHGFASSIGGLFNIPHGLVCGSLMAKANEVTVRKLRGTGQVSTPLIKYSQLGNLFSGKEGRSNDFYTDAFIDYLHYMNDLFHFPGFKQFGMSADDISRICLSTENKNNPVKLNKEEIEEILVSRFF